MSLLKPNTTFALITLISVSALGYFYILQGEKGKKYFVRKLPAADFVDAALKHATDLSGTVCFCAGDNASLSTTYAAPTTAGMEVLRYAARYCGKYKTKLIAVIMGRTGSGGDMIALEKEIIRDAYEEEDNVGDYSPQMVRYLGGDRSAYETAIFDLFVQEKVKTNLWCGPLSGGVMQPSIMANALDIFHVSGGTDMFQIPHQQAIATYFMIGEELYAVGAFLSEESAVRASLKIGDYTKYAFLAILILGNIAVWAGSTLIKNLLGF